MEEFISPNWKKWLESEFKKKYFKSIQTFLHNNSHEPPIEKIFAFTQFVPLEETKVVILGQDPYFSDGTATGLAFSVHEGTTIPRSLKTIFKELQNDIKGFKKPKHGDLTLWANRGVLLLNTVLTVYKKPESHYGIGWEKLTDRIIELVSEKCNNVVFMLWGEYAQSKQKLIKNPNKHLILCAPHPSYRGGKYFLGCKHFSQANKYLVEHGKEPIGW